MRVLVLAKEGEQSGSPTPPTAEAMAEFQKFNEELVKAGVVLGSGRLYPSSQGRRVRFDGKKRTVIDGPFAETKELVGGYWLWQVRSFDEALEWLKRAPFDGGVFEVRQILEFEGM
ncbi:MAG: YciI family protein [Chloroflexi bacterium]|nr:MAG: YciI family protein [Chloroflexota bacterium]